MNYRVFVIRALDAENAQDALWSAVSSWLGEEQDFEILATYCPALLSWERSRSSAPCGIFDSFDQFKAWVTERIEEACGGLTFLGPSFAPTEAQAVAFASAYINGHLRRHRRPALSFYKFNEKRDFNTIAQFHFGVEHVGFGPNEVPDFETKDNPYFFIIGRYF